MAYSEQVSQLTGTEEKYGDVSYWLSEISRAQKSADMQRWTERCKNIRVKYRDDESKERRIRQYAILWSNMETIKPAVYAKPPKAVVQRRYRDSDPVGRIATEILQRAINFTFETNDFDSRIKQVRDDYLLYSRGVARVFYEPVILCASISEREPIATS